MGKIGKLVLFSEYHNISHQKMIDMCVFDPIVNLDTHLFIDPLLLKTSSHKIINTQAVEEYNTYFSSIISLLSLSNKEDDFAWEHAISQLPAREIDGTCLGYGTNSISGRSIDIKVKKSIICTAKEIVNIGIKDPELFSILPLFNKGIGPDTISDITTRAIHKSLLQFSALQAKRLKIQLVKKVMYGEDFYVIPNPIKKDSHILLLPTDILRQLPLVNKWDDIAKAASFNSELRDRVNKLTGEIFKQRNQSAQEEYISNILRNKDAVKDLVQVVKSYKGEAYNQILDNERLVVFAKATNVIKNESFPSISFIPNQQGLENLVETIIERFKFLIEDKGLNKLLWKEDKSKRCKEWVPQLIFHSLALIYCEANDIDVNPETDTGTGLIDFKFSQGYVNKVVVELKYSDNNALIHGLETQLPTYVKSEEANKGYYVVLDVGKLGTKIKRLEEIKNSQQQCDVIYIDAKIKKSASKI